MLPQNIIVRYRQLNDTKKELVYSKTAVNDYSDEIKENGNGNERRSQSVESRW